MDPIHFSFYTKTESQKTWPDRDQSTKGAAYSPAPLSLRFSLAASDAVFFLPSSPPPTESLAAVL